MTQPRIVRASLEPLYQGRFAQTRFEQEEVVGADGSSFVAPVWHVINAAHDPELLDHLGTGTLNQVVCPDTGKVETLLRSVVVHSPEARLLVLVIPEAAREEQINRRIALLGELAEERDEAPPYVLDFFTVVGRFGRAELHALADRRRTVEDLEAVRRRLGLIAAEQERERIRLEQWTRELEQTEQLMRRGEIAIRMAHDDDPTDVFVPDGDGGPFESDLDPVDEEVTAVHFDTPYTDLSESLEVLTSADIEILSAADTPRETTPVSVEGESVSAPGATTSERSTDPALALALWPDPELPGQPVDVSDLPVGSVRKAEASGRLALHVVAEPKVLAAFQQAEPEPFVQLHRLPTYPIIDILLVASDRSGVPVEELACTFDVLDEADRSRLDRLAQACTFEVHLYDEERARVQYFSFRLPLERNVAYLVDRAEEWLDENASHDRDAALEIFNNEGFERLSARKHNFHRNSFAEITSASAARLAVSIVGYWSEAQNSLALIENRSFPLDHFRAIRDRVIHAAVRFGIYLPPELRERAVTLCLAEKEIDLVELLIDRFYEATAQVRGVDLDIVVQAENWDQLRGAVAELGGVVEAHVDEWADAVKRRAHRVSSSPGIDPLDLINTAEYDRVESLAEISNEELQALLTKGGVAPAVSRELVGRGGETNIFYVIEGARALDDDGLLATARFLAAGADAFEPALLMGLGRVHSSTVHLCALSLAMARRAEALPTLIELLHDAQRGAGLPIRDILTEYGAEAIPALFEAVEERGATDELVEVLAMISVDAGPEIINALRDRPTATVLKAAQRLSEVRRKLGGRRATSLAERARALTDTADEDPEGDEA